MVTQWIPGDKHRASKLAASATTNSCFLGSLAPQIQKLWTTTSRLSLSENQGSIENLQWQSICFFMDSHAILPDCWGIEVDVSTKLGQEDIPEWFGICNLIVVPRSKKKVLFKNQHFFPGMVWKTTLRTWCFTWSLVTTPSGLPSAQLCPDDPQNPDDWGLGLDILDHGNHGTLGDPDSFLQNGIYGPYGAWWKIGPDLPQKIRDPISTPSTHEVILFTLEMSISRLAGLVGRASMGIKIACKRSRTRGI